MTPEQLVEALRREVISWLGAIDNRIDVFKEDIKKLADRMDAIERTQRFTPHPR